MSTQETHERQAVTPRVDVFENKDEVLLVADLPGVTEQTLKIDVDEEHLTIDGRPGKDPAKSPLEREFRLFDYRRRFLVPDGTDRSRIVAELKEGVLYLHLPKVEKAKPRRIEVKLG